MWPRILYLERYCQGPSCFPSPRLFSLSTTTTTTSKPLQFPILYLSSTMGGGHHGHTHGPPPPRPQGSSHYDQHNFAPGAKWIKDLTKNRLGTFEGGHFSDVNLSSVLYSERVDDRKLIELMVWSAPGKTKPTFEEAMKQEFKEAKKGDSFGPSCMLTLVSYTDEIHGPDLRSCLSCRGMLVSSLVDNRVFTELSTDQSLVESQDPNPFRLEEVRDRAV